MHSGPANDKATSGDQIHSNYRLRESDLMWIRRGQRLGESLMTNRAYAAGGWATGVALIGGSLVLLALLGSPEAGVGLATGADASAP